MPRGDRTGPDGKGPMTGRTKGIQSTNQFNNLGRNQGISAGPIGDCICIKCGTKIKHQRGVPCTQLKCPKCGAQMTRGD